MCGRTVSIGVGTTAVLVGSITAVSGGELVTVDVAV
jgi:hypothetical protein